MARSPRAARRGARVITTAVEHPAIARAVDALAARGARVTRLAGAARCPAERGGRRRARERAHALVALQWVNHETGTMVPALAGLARRTRRVARAPRRSMPRRRSASCARRRDASARPRHRSRRAQVWRAIGSRRALVAPGPPARAGAHRRRAGARPASWHARRRRCAGLGAACASSRAVSPPCRASASAQPTRGRAARGGRRASTVRAPRVATVANASVRGLRGRALVRGARRRGRRSGERRGVQLGPRRAVARALGHATPPSPGARAPRCG